MESPSLADRISVLFLVAAATHDEVLHIAIVYNTNSTLANNIIAHSL